MTTREHRPQDLCETWRNIFSGTRVDNVEYGHKGDYKDRLREWTSCLGEYRLRASADNGFDGTVDDQDDLCIMCRHVRAQISLGDSPVRIQASKILFDDLDISNIGMERLR